MSYIHKHAIHIISPIHKIKLKNEKPRSKIIIYSSNEIQHN